MAKIHGKGTVALLNAVDMSTHSNNLEWARTGDSHDVTTYGKNAHVKQGGLLDGTAKISGFYDDTATGPRGVIEPLIGTVVPMVFRPEGTGAGKPMDTVNVLVVSYKETSAVADMIMWEAEVEFSDDVVTADQV
ncbi:MAG TPA: hypothetical protein VK611_21590 [Acidimicrobiales bacterium]|nr:hypothetical protein [Acidimicrobiales bacterium]